MLLLWRWDLAKKPFISYFPLSSKTHNTIILLQTALGQVNCMVAVRLRCYCDRHILKTAHDPRDIITNQTKLAYLLHITLANHIWSTVHLFITD